MNSAALREWIDSKVDRSLARPTRIHKLPSANGEPLYVKREDELSSGISGSKLRKYASLLPAWRHLGIQEVAIIAGPSSNNAVGLLQILREASIRPWLFLREAGDGALRGNALFLDMLAPPEAIQSIPRRDWPQAESIAQAFLDQRSALGRRVCLLPEGALCADSMPGAISLATDLLRNEAESNLRFRHLFVDSGTGCTAIGLALGLALLDPLVAERNLHITLIAGSPEGFQDALIEQKAQLPDPIRTATNALPKIEFLYPPLGKSFGSVGPELLRHCRAVAQSEGLLMDPVYSVKHYMAMQVRRQNLAPQTPCLFIYNGGSLGLAGFQDQLALG